MYVSFIRPIYSSGIRRVGLPLVAAREEIYAGCPGFKPRVVEGMIVLLEDPGLVAYLVVEILGVRIDVLVVQVFTADPKSRSASSGGQYTV